MLGGSKKPRIARFFCLAACRILSVEAGIRQGEARFSTPCTPMGLSIKNRRQMAVQTASQPAELSPTGCWIIAAAGSVLNALLLAGWQTDSVQAVNVSSVPDGQVHPTVRPPVDEPKRIESTARHSGARWRDNAWIRTSHETTLPNSGLARCRDGSGHCAQHDPAQRARHDKCRDCHATVKESIGEPESKNPIHSHSGHTRMDSNNSIRSRNRRRIRRIHRDSGMSR